jgi:hypothetical protein
VASRYQIRRGEIPEPVRGRPRQFPIDELAVGQFFETADTTYHSLHSCCLAFKRRHCGECEFKVTKTRIENVDGWRVTRVK